MRGHLACLTRAVTRAEVRLDAWDWVLSDRCKHDHPRSHLRTHALDGAHRAYNRFVDAARDNR